MGAEAFPCPPAQGTPPVPVPGGRTPARGCTRPQQPPLAPRHRATNTPGLRAPGRAQPGSRSRYGAPGSSGSTGEERAQDAGLPAHPPPSGPAAPTRRRAAPLPAHRQDTVSSTLVPGTLPAAGSSAPGDAIPVRAPPLLRAASSRAAEAGAPGGGHGHGGPGPGGSAAPVNGGLGPGPRHGEEPEGGDGRPVGAAA